MCLPSASTWIALTDPHLRPSGNVPQLRTVSYGLGRLLIGVTTACSGGPDDPRGGPAGACGGADGACATRITETAVVQATTVSHVFIRYLASGIVLAR